MMGKVREKHARYKKNAIAFWRKKIIDCYSLQAQVGRSVPYELALLREIIAICKIIIIYNYPQIKRLNSDRALSCAPVRIIAILIQQVHIN